MMCQVTSEHQFSAAIREDIKFAVSLRNSKGKERVPTRQDLCSLSHDGKRFSFGFDTNQLGAYKVRKPCYRCSFMPPGGGLVQGKECDRESLQGGSHLRGWFTFSRFLTEERG